MFSSPNSLGTLSLVVADIVIQQAADTIEIVGLDGNLDGSYHLLIQGTSSIVTGEGVLCYINNIEATNYQYQYLGGSGVSAVGGNTTNTYPLIGIFHGTAPTTIDVDISMSKGYVNMLANSTRFAAAPFSYRFGVRKLTAVENIKSIIIKPVSGFLVKDSRVILYKRG